jgi:hypothetical protein
MNPWDVTGRHKVKNCGEKRTKWNYNANGGNNYFHKVNSKPRSQHPCINMERNGTNYVKIVAE